MRFAIFAIDDDFQVVLDAVLAMLQAAWCAREGAPRYGLPAGLDPLEGWIATTPFA